MKNYLFLLVIVLVSGCVSKKKYTQLVERNCEAESELLMKNFNSNYYLESLAKWKNIDKKCGETSEKYFMSGALVYGYLAHRAKVEKNETLMNNYKDTCENLYKKGIEKIPSTPMLKMMYASFLRDQKLVSDLDYYTLMREAIHNDDSKIKTHIIYRFIAAAEKVAQDKTVSKSQLTEDFMRLIELDIRDNFGFGNNSSYDEKLLINAHLYFDCTGLSDELKKLNTDFGYNYYYVKHYSIAYEKLECEKDTEITGILQRVKKQESERNNYNPNNDEIVTVPNFTREEIEAESIFTVVEKQASFPGGEAKLMEFIEANLRYPKTAKERGIKGKVYIQFLVEEDGSLSEIKVIRGIGGGCDEEAKRLINKMPKWEPGEQRGKPVKVRFVLPLKFEPSRN